MSPDACREWRGALAAAALGHLDDAESIALHAHLDGCTACRAELVDLLSVARALPLADPAHIADDRLEPSPGLIGGVIERISAEHDRARHLRIVRLVAVAAVLALVIGIVAVLTTNADDDAEATRVSFPVSAGATGYADLVPLDEGTQVRLLAQGLDAGDWYWLWLTGDDGDRVTAGTFTGTPDGDLEVTLTAALPLDDARRIWVTDGDDEVVLDARI